MGLFASIFYLSWRIARFEHEFERKVWVLIQPNTHSLMSRIIAIGYQLFLALVGQLLVRFLRATFSTD
jgi:putative AlgH/UPF0301 family transcriptional regulator